MCASAETPPRKAEMMAAMALPLYQDSQLRNRLMPLLSAPLFALLAACADAGRGQVVDASKTLDLALDAPRRCSYCAWIESKEEVGAGLPGPHGPTVYEYTVRKADGSSSIFREQMPVSWRRGERLISIDGG
jgi:hypothetical protein